MDYNKLKELFPYILVFVIIFVVAFAYFLIRRNPPPGPVLPTPPPIPGIIAPPLCTNFKYSDWSNCDTNGTQNRTTIKELPEGCIGGNPIRFQGCNYEPPPIDILELTNPLFEKYLHLTKVLNLSLPFFEQIYQKQQNRIVDLQHLQSISYSPDVATVLSIVRDESNELLGVITTLKDEQSKVVQGMEKLNMANKTFRAKSVSENFLKFVYDETRSVNDWLWLFDPENPDNIGDVTYERDQAIYKLQEVLISK